ncbi:MAG: hypothetical protein KF791_19680, partial [Verrucomicrobiae bacterium]|nr:hypothetical protein [Verrucomicrobiae bacterium]
TKSAVRYVTRFEDAMVRLALKHKVHGVICGHIHRAEQRTIRGLLYLNSGDWVESCTAIAEDEEGRFEILRWHELTRPVEAGPSASVATAPPMPPPGAGIPAIPGPAPIRRQRSGPRPAHAPDRSFALQQELTGIVEGPV